MAQIARPDSDITVGSWSPYPASPTTLWDKLDEVTPNGDTDYIVSSTDEDECELSLTDVTDPEVGTGHKIRCYAKSPVGAGAAEQMYISLVENGTERARSATENVNRTAYGLIEYTLSEAEANAIGNYANLRIRAHITKTDADEPIRITQLEFECPDATPPQTLIPDGIASLEGFGSQKVNFKVFPSAIGSLENFGTSKLNHRIEPGAIGSLEAFGDAGVKHIIVLSPDGIASLEGFGDAKLNLRLLLSSVASLEGFGTPSVIRSLSPSAIASLETFGTFKLNLRLLMQAIANGETFGTPNVSLGGGITLSPNGIASLESFGSARLNLRIFPEGIANPEGIVGLWHLDEGSGMVAHDDSGLGNDGDLINMEEADWVDGKVGKCLDFDGDNDHVEVPDDDSLDITDAITITAWIKRGETGVAHAVLTKYHSGDDKRSYRFVINAANKLQFNFSTDGLFQAANVVVGLINITDSDWHFVVATRNGAVARVYLDGQLDNEKTDCDTGSIDVSDAVVKIGSRDNAEFFKGLIDEVRIYNRVLSEGEISDLKSLGTAQLNFRLFPSAIESLEGFGTAFMNLQQTVRPSGIVSAEMHGQPQLDFIIFPEGIASLEAFGFDSILKLIAKIFQVTPRDKVFEVDPREKTFQVKPRKKIFIVDRSN